MQRLWNKYFILVLIIGTLAFVATRILDATVTLYADSLGIGTSFSGLIVTTFSISAALVRIISGNLTDRFGRRIFLATGSILFAVSVFGLGGVDDPAGTSGSSRLSRHGVLNNHHRSRRSRRRCYPGTSHG